MKTKIDLGLSVAFAVGLLVPAALGYWAPTSAVLPNTPQEPLPRRPWLRNFPRRFESFFDSHLGGRAFLVTLHHAQDAYAFHVSPTEAVALGTNGWAYLNQDFMPESLAGGPFPEDLLHEWVGVFKRTQSWVGTWGGQVLVVVAPNKASVYPEYLPDVLTRGRGVPRLDAFVKRFFEEGIEVLDLRAPLLAAKPAGQLYLRRDTHWQGEGLVVAAESIAQRIGAMLGQPMGSLTGAFRMDTKPHVGDLDNLMSLARWSTEERLVPVALQPRALRLPLSPDSVAAGQFVWKEGAVVYAGGAAQTPHVVIHHDSFGVPLQATLPQALGRSTWLYWTGSFNAAVIERERPQLVIYLMAERYLHSEPPQAVQAR